jgi:hypothetical protein
VVLMSSSSLSLQLGKRICVWWRSAGAGDVQIFAALFPASLGGGISFGRYCIVNPIPVTSWSEIFLDAVVIFVQSNIVCWVVRRAVCQCCPEQVIHDSWSWPVLSGAGHPWLLELTSVVRSWSWQCCPEQIVTASWSWQCCPEQIVIASWSWWWRPKRSLSVQ